MCGIAGSVDFTRSPERRVLYSQLETIVHRGPDARGMYLDKYVALGIQRLSIIDLKTGNQPIANEDKTLVVVFNGEIYNYQSLQSQLINLGHTFKTKSDTETLVHLYEEYGTSFPARLNGMFAFALWDNKKQELFLARDQIGVKPLFYYHKGPLLVFGSEIKAILVHPQVKKEVDPKGVAAYAQFGYVGKNSIFKHVYKLPPGKSLLFGKKGLTHSSYFKLTDNFSNSSDETLEDLLFRVVDRQSIADVPVGVFLSGGIDSSLLLYYLSQIQRKKIHTFSVGFKENTFNEVNFAREVAYQLKSNHHETYLEASELNSLLPRVLAKLDEPLADPSLIPTYKISELAREHVKVVLSGDGGDELFAGYPTYQGHLLAAYVSRLPQALLLGLKSLTAYLPVRKTNFPLREVAQVFLEDISEPPLRRHLTWMKLLFANAQDLLRPELQQGMNEAQLDELAPLHTDTVTQIQILDVVTFLRDALLVKADRASMFNSLELRVPYLDLELIAGAFSLQRSKKIDLRETKKPLRQLAKKIFPSSIWRRPKKGFGIPLAEWLQSDLIPFVDCALERDELYSFFERKKVLTLLEKHRRMSLYNRQIWLVSMFSEWLHYWGNV